MFLADAPKDSECLIIDSLSTGRARARLDSMGLMKGATVSVLDSTWIGLIVEIRSTQLAVSEAIAKTLVVEILAQHEGR